MFKKLNKKGFTLAELLIVVAIIGVLVAVSIPIFTAQLRKAKLATNQANARAAEAALVTGLLDSSKTYGSAVYDVDKGTIGAITDVTADATALTIATNPSTWTVDDTLSGSDQMGDKTAHTWTVQVNKDGASFTAGNLK